MCVDKYDMSFVTARIAYPMQCLVKLQDEKWDKISLFRYLPMHLIERHFLTERTLYKEDRDIVDTK